MAFIGLGFWSAAQRDNAGAITHAGSISWSELRAGDCFNSEATGTVANVAAVLCRDSHVYEVFYVGELADSGTYPETSAQDAFAERECTPAFESYVGHDFQTSVWFASYIGPSEDAFSQGTRTMVCYLFNSTETPVTGSARASGR